MEDECTLSRETRNHDWLRLLEAHLKGFDFAGSHAICMRLQAEPKAQSYHSWAAWMAILQDMYLLDVSRSSEMLQQMRQLKLLNEEDRHRLSQHWDRLLPSSESRERQMGLLHELVYQMELHLEGDFNSAFLIKIYRFREILSMFLLTETTSGDEYRSMLGRSSQFLPALFSKYHSGALDGFEGAYFFLRSKQLSDTIELRNRSLVGHGRIGVSDVELESEYEGYPRFPEGSPATRFLADMSILFRDLRCPLQENPYRVLVNRMCTVLGEDIQPLILGDKKNEMIMELIEENLQAHQYKAILTLIHGRAEFAHIERLVNIGRRLLWGSVSKNGLDVFLDYARRSATLAVRYQSLKKWWGKLQRGDQESIIYLLFAQMKVFAQRGHYDEWLARAYRLTEELLTFYLGLDIKSKDSGNTKMEVVNRVAVTHSCLNQLRDHSTHQLMLHRLYPLAKSFQEVYTPLSILQSEWVDRLMTLHWQAFIGHGDKPLSASSIAQSWRSVEDVTDDFKQVMNQLGLKQRRDWFRDIHTLIMEQM